MHSDTVIEILSPAHAKGEKSLNDFTLGTFTGRFPSDGAASMAVKGLKAPYTYAYASRVLLA